MRKTKIESIYNKYHVQLIILAVIIMISLLVILSLFNNRESSDINILKESFAYILFGNAIIGSAVFSFSSTKRSIKFQTSLGITRKEIYRSYMIKNIQVLAWTIGIYFYYMMIDKVIENNSREILTSLINERTGFLVLLFISYSLVSFFLGIVRISPFLFGSLLVFASLGSWIYFINASNMLIGDLFLLIIVISFVIMDRVMITKGKIR